MVSVSMKNIGFLFIGLFCCLLLIACGDSKDNNQPVTAEKTQVTSEPVAAKEPAATTSNATQPASSGAVSAEVMAMGEKVYLRNCVACHQPNGKGIPPAFPSIFGSAVVQGELTGQISLILNGVTGTAMVAFGPQLTDEEIAAVVTYQRNSFGNSTGDQATAEQVKAQR